MISTPRLSEHSQILPHIVAFSGGSSHGFKFMILWCEPYSAGRIKWLNPVSVP
jgi:hypothetical protein